MLRSRTVTCWKRHKRLAATLFGNGFSAITSNFQFSWWLRDHFSAPFMGLYLPNTWSQTFQTSKRHTFRVSAFHRYHWFGVKLFPVGCARVVEGTLTTRKMLFWIWLRPRVTKFRNFFTITPVLTFTLTVLPLKSRRSVVSIGLRVRYK